MPTLAQTIASATAEAVQGVLGGSEAMFTRVAQAGGHAVNDSLLDDVGKFTTILSNLIGSIPIVGGIVNDVLNPLSEVENAGGKIGRGFGAGWILGYAGYQLLQPLLRQVTHAVEDAFTSQIFDAATAATLAAKGIITPTFGASEAAGEGLDQSHFNQLLDSARPRPALGEALRLWNLKAIDDRQLEECIQHAGLPAEFHGPLKELSRALLSPADLALANLRGFMDDTTMYGYAEQLGVTKRDVDVLVANTGEPPGLMQLLEAYRRAIIPKDRLEHGIRQSRVRNEWIDVVEALRYRPPDLGIIVQGAIRHAIDTGAAKSLAAETGLNPDNWDLVLAAHGRPIGPHEALDLYRRGQFTQAQVERAIRQSDIRDEYIPALLNLSRTLIPARTISTIVRHGVRDQAWGIKQLQAHGYTADDAAALISSALTTKTAAVKELTERQILDLYEVKGINRQEAESRLAEIGYSGSEATLILDATQASATLKEQNRAISATRSAFLADRITETEAGVQLDKLGVLAAHRTNLLAAWKIERAGIVKSLNEGQMTAAYHYGVWSREYTLKKLQAIGYSEADATVLLDIRDHGLKPGQPPLNIGGPQ